MKRLLVVLVFLAIFSPAQSQWQCRVLDAISGEPLQAATITLFSSVKRAGLVASKEGVFSVAVISLYDSIRVSMVGYRSKTVYPAQFVPGRFTDIALEPAPAELGEVIIKRTTATDIIRKVIAAIPSFQPSDDFESRVFTGRSLRTGKIIFLWPKQSFLHSIFPVKNRTG